MDKFDRRILSILQADASITAADLGEQIGLSQSQVWRRIERLEQEGILLKRVALVDRKKAGLSVMLYAQVKLKANSHDSIPDFAKAIQKFPEVLDCHLILGPADFILRIVAKDMDAYEKFFSSRLTRLPMVQEVHSMVALSQIKSSTALPIEPA